MVYWGLTPQQQPGSYQGGEMMMKSVFWWRKPEYPEETTDLRQVTDETFSHIRPLPSPGIELTRVTTTDQFYIPGVAGQYTVPCSGRHRASATTWEVQPV